MGTSRRQRRQQERSGGAEPAWRQFEKRAAELRKILGEQSILVECPGHPLDKITNSKREVDVLITYPDGRRASVECRKRSSPQDVTWIEQLATKKKDLGLFETFAVSEKGFSKACTEKAKHWGIKLCTLAEYISDDLSFSFTINRVYFGFKDYLPQFTFAEDDYEKIWPHLLETWPDFENKFISSGGSIDKVNFRFLIDRVIELTKEHPDKFFIPEGCQESSILTVRGILEKNKYAILSPFGTAIINQIDVKFQLSKAPVEVISTKETYSYIETGRNPLLMIEMENKPELFKGSPFAIIDLATRTVRLGHDFGLL